MNRKKPNNNVYAVFASVYDALMSEKKYAGWNELIADVVTKYVIPKDVCLDVACGTGRISRLLLNQGFRVIGVDISKEMLAVARHNFPQSDFVQTDVRQMNLSGFPAADFAVCFYDSLNYLLTDKDMTAAFRAVSRNLKPGAIFLFDMNTRDHVLASQHNNARVFESDKFFATFRFSGKKRIWTLDIDLFLKQKTGAYKHFRERHTERGYDIDDIAPLLKKAGFSLLETRQEFKRYEDGKEHLSRLYFVASKNS